MPRIDPHQEVIDMIVSSATEEDIGACIDELKAVVAARRIVAIAASKAA
jgi:translation initiation factor 2 alpha subunit (eIF-2alpha)